METKKLWAPLAYRQKQSRTFQFRIRLSRLGVFSKICRNSCVSSAKELQATVTNSPKTDLQFFTPFLHLQKRIVKKKNNRICEVPSKSSKVTVGSTYSHQCLPSVETGISQLDHLHARCMHTQATTGGQYCRQKVVKCRLGGRTHEKREREETNQPISTSKFPP